MDFFHILIGSIKVLSVESMSSLDGKETVQLTDEDKAWLKQRKKNTNQAASIGGGLGFMTLLALLSRSPPFFCVAIEVLIAQMLFVL